MASFHLRQKLHPLPENPFPALQTPSPLLPSPQTPPLPRMASLTPNLTTSKVSSADQHCLPQPRERLPAYLAFHMMSHNNDNVLQGFDDCSQPMLMMCLHSLHAIGDGCCRWKRKL